MQLASVTDAPVIAKVPGHRRISRLAVEMAKRRAEKQLTESNWDEEEKAPEPGEFERASEEVLRNRTIRKAKRSLPTQSGKEPCWVPCAPAVNRCDSLADARWRAQRTKAMPSSRVRSARSDRLIYT